MRERNSITIVKAPAYVSWLAVAYTLFLAYCSMVDVGESAGWREPTDPYWSFLFAAWVPKMSTFDVIANVLAYVPIGTLFSWNTPHRWSISKRVCSATLFGFSLSFLMETLQMWLPTRDPSPVDLFTNFVGALIGALAAVRLYPPRHPVQALRSAYERTFVPGKHSKDCLIATFAWFLLMTYPLLPKVDGDQILNALQPLSTSLLASPGEWHIETLMSIAFAITGLGILLQNATFAKQPITAIFSTAILATVVLQAFIVGRVLTIEYAVGSLLGLLLYMGIIGLRIQRVERSYMACLFLLVAYLAYRLTDPVVEQAHLEWSLEPEHSNLSNLVSVCIYAFLSSLAIVSTISADVRSPLRTTIATGILIIGSLIFEYRFLPQIGRAGAMAPVFAGICGSLLALRPSRS